MKKLTIRDDAGDDAPRGAIRLPPLQAPRDVVIPDLPKPSDYWRSTPAVLGDATLDLTDRVQRRRRLIIGFTVAAVAHVALVLGWLLSPPLRLKAGYAPERWVPVLSLPASPAPSPSAAGHPPATPVAAAPTTPSRATAPTREQTAGAAPRPADPSAATHPKPHLRHRPEPPPT